jgi:hypothetical protein
MADEFIEQPEIDCGLVAGNYFDYRDDEVALQAETDLLNAVASFEDEKFPADARALYFDPMHPPKGALAGQNVLWHRIGKGEVMDCGEPIFCAATTSTPLITSGALGDNYFVNAMRLLACNPSQITRLLVSERYAKNGIYTFKFYKAGSWRYVHIDDRIPCRQSGRVHFARNEDPNETFAMLLEKAYAKLHGCYEALIHGIMEKAMQDLTPAGHCRVVRNEWNMDLSNICDQVWAELEEGLHSKKMVGCAKLVPDPYSEKLVDRQGITVGCIYQVIDMEVVTAYATEDLDRLTVGMVCVRNLQKSEGFHNGPWSVGHQNWVLYREIGLKLRHKTREIMYSRGLGLDPNEKDEDGNLVNFVKEDEFFDTEDRTAIDQFLALEQPDEPDELHQAFLGRANLMSPQPYERDIHWIQIEDFVDIFNRVYCLTDCSFMKGAKKEGDDQKKKEGGKKIQVETKKFYSKWIPQDSLVGSGGPPLELPSEVDVGRVDELTKRKANLDNTLGALEKSMAALDAREEKKKEAAEGQSQGQGQGEEKSGTVAFLETTAEDEEGLDEELNEGAGFVIYQPGDSDDEGEDGKGGFKGAVAPEAGESGVEGGSSSKVDDEDSPGVGLYHSLELNDAFTDNPMYPFTVSEPAHVCVTLYQPDRRWSVARLGDDPRDITSDYFASRGERLAACMDYGRKGIGFVVVKLFGMKVRCTEFKLRKMVGCSDCLAYSNTASTSVHLLPGRYAVIPYTNLILEEREDYLLHFHYKTGAVELEVEDVIAQKLSDDVASDDESDEEEYEDDEEEEEKMTEEEIEERDRKRALASQKKKFNALAVKPPLPYKVPEWEYTESTEELGVVSIFDEVGDLSRYLNSFRVELKKLEKTIEDFRLYGSGGGQRPKEASEDDKRPGSVRGGSRRGNRSPNKPRAGSPPKTPGGSSRKM